MERLLPIGLTARGVMRVAQAVGRPATTVGPDGYLLEDLLWCGVCRRPMDPAPRADGTRAYHCGPGCARPDVPALPLEQSLLLAALVRAHSVLYGVGRSSARPGTPVSPGEVRRWQWCDLLDRSSVLRTAYVRVTVDSDGTPHPVWRHESDNVADARGHWRELAIALQTEAERSGNREPGGQPAR